MKKKKTEANPKYGRIILNNKNVIYTVATENKKPHVLMQLSIKELEDLVKAVKNRKRHLKKEIKDLDCFVVHPFLDVSLIIN
jgi:hypothetical protein